MSQQQEDPQDQGTEGGERIADLRAAADDGRRAKRELAFVKAGIDTDTPLGKMFASAYDGDLTKDAITERWKEIAPETPAPTPEQAAAQQEQQQLEEQANMDEVQRQAQQDRARRGIASTPAEAPPEEHVDPLKRGYEGFHKNLADGVDRERAAKPVFEEIIGAAVGGDERFIFRGWTDEELRDGRVSRA